MPGNTQKVVSWRAQLALLGISRRQAARALHLSLSALDKRLKGERGLSAREERLLAALTEKGMKA